MMGVNAKPWREPPARTFTEHLTMKALRKGLGKLDEGLRHRAKQHGRSVPVMMSRGRSLPSTG
jgi:hypothetical protein